MKNGSRKQPAKKQPPKKASKQNVSKNTKRKESQKKAGATVSRNVRNVIPSKKTKLKVIDVTNLPINIQYENAVTMGDILALLSKHKRLRYKGRFIPKEAQDNVLRFASILDNEKIPYTLKEILDIPDLQKKILITHDETGKELFYWNVHNKVLKGSFGEDLKIKIKDFDGSVIYEGTSEFKASQIIQKINRKIMNLEKVIIEKEDLDNIYPTIPVFETRRDGTNIKILIDFSGIKVRVLDVIWNKYKSML